MQTDIRNREKKVDIFFMLLLLWCQLYVRRISEYMKARQLAHAHCYKAIGIQEMMQTHIGGSVQPHI